jgi:hypothetical protein
VGSAPPPDPAKDVISRDGSFNDHEVEYECPHLGQRVMVVHAHRVARDEDGMPIVLLSIEDDMMAAGFPAPSA